MNSQPEENGLPRAPCRSEKAARGPDAPDMADAEALRIWRNAIVGLDSLYRQMLTEADRIRAHADYGLKPLRVLLNQIRPRMDEARQLALFVRLLAEVKPGEFIAFVFRIRRACLLLLLEPRKIITALNLEGVADCWIGDDGAYEIARLGSDAGPARQPVADADHTADASRSRGKRARDKKPRDRDAEFRGSSRSERPAPPAAGAHPLRAERPTLSAEEYLQLLARMEPKPAPPAASGSRGEPSAGPAVASADTPGSAPPPAKLAITVGSAKLPGAAIGADSDSDNGGQPRSQSPTAHANGEPPKAPPAVAGDSEAAVAPKPSTAEAAAPGPAEPPTVASRGFRRYAAVVAGVERRPADRGNEVRAAPTPVETRAPRGSLVAGLDASRPALARAEEPRAEEPRAKEPRVVADSSRVGKNPGRKEKGQGRREKEPARATARRAATGAAADQARVSSAGAYGAPIAGWSELQVPAGLPAAASWYDMYTDTAEASTPMPGQPTTADSKQLKSAGPAEASSGLEPAGLGPKIPPSPADSGLGGSEPAGLGASEPPTGSEHSAPPPSPDPYDSCHEDEDGEPDVLL